jgi:hypothetical protein
MGLDMYLTKRIWVSPDERAKLTITGVEGVKTARVKFILEDAGYWRKANAIHQWFVENVQAGEADCREYYVSRTQLEALLVWRNRYAFISRCWPAAS